MIKRTRARWVVVGLALALAMLVASCGEGNSDQAEPTSAGTASELRATSTPPENILSAEDVLRKGPSVTKRETLKWGYMFELSGNLQGFGKPTSDGVRLAVDEINKAGGFQVGDTIYTIDLVERDTKSDVSQTIADTTELIRDEHVNVIWGPATFGEPDATQITQAQYVLHFCPCQQRETTALSSVEKAQNESHWAFQTLLPFSLLIEKGAQNFVHDYPDVTTMALLCANNATGHDICSRTRDAYEKQGIEVVAEEYFPAGTTSDYSPYLTKIKQKDPEYLFNYEDPPKDASLVRQAIELGVGRIQGVVIPANLVDSLIGGPFDLPIIAGAAPRQEVKPTSPAAAAYFDRYRAFLGGQLPFAAFVSLFTYDYAYMLAGAMQQAGTVEDTTAIADALEDLHYHGVAEDDMFFNSRHFSVHGTDPCTVLRGEITCQHVPPPESAKE